MLNESVYRSPKWLRKFVDFEINTGEDVTGNRSTKDLEKDTVQEFISRFQKIDWDSFRDFFNSKVSPEPFLKKFSGFDRYLLDDDMEKFIKYYLNIKGEDKLLILNQYDSWLRERDTKEKLVRKIIKLMKDDFVLSPYKDKFNVLKNSDKYIKYEYYFEEGEYVSLQGSLIVWEASGGDYDRSNGITIESDLVLSFVLAFDDLHAKANLRNIKANTIDSKKVRYDTIGENVKEMGEKLTKMLPEDPNRDSVEKKLLVLIRLRNAMQKKYKF